MKTYTKNYIGKGTAHETLDIVKVTLSVDQVLKYQHEYNGEKYISFELARMQSPDRFDRTHTAYVSIREDDQQDPIPQGKAAKAKKQK